MRNVDDYFSRFKSVILSILCILTATVQFAAQIRLEYAVQYTAS